MRFVFKHLPLSFHNNAEPAARASIAAANQDRFWEYHGLLYDNQRSIERTDLEAYAEQLDLDIDAFLADIDDPGVADRVADDATLAAAVGARGTPNFFINGHRFRGAQSIDAFRAVIDEQLAEARELQESGVDHDEIYETLLADAPRTIE